MAALLFAAGHILGQNLTREQYINKYKDIAVTQMHKHKIPASITLAQACLESDNGNSTLARKAKNECFRKYKNAKDSFTDHSYFLISGNRYNSLFDLKITDYKAWAHGLKAAGYATNPKYAKLLIDIIEEYRLYELDTPYAHKSVKKEEKIARKLKKLEQKAAKAEAKSRKANEKLQKFREKHLIWAPPVKPIASDKSTANGASATLDKATVYTVKAGDTLYSIARKYRTTVDSILKLNPGLKATELKIGTEITVKQ